MTLELNYQLASAGLFAWLTDRIFVRGQVRQSLKRPWPACGWRPRTSWTASLPPALT